MGNAGAVSSEPGGWREVGRIAGPLILGMASYTVMQFTDRVFLSRFSSVAIQAALPAGVLAHTSTCFFQTLAGYAGTFTAQYHGARRHGESVRASVQGLWLSVLSWPLIAALVPIGNWILSFSGHSAEVLAAERAYFGILTYGGIMVSLNAAAGGFFMGIGKTGVNFAANTAGCVLNILLNYMMIFGHWGCPRWGVAGAAWATLISGLAAFVLQMAVMAREPAVREEARRAGLRMWALDVRLLRRIMRFGSPAGLQTMMDIGAFAAFILMTGRLGDLAQSASNIAFSINNLAFAPLLGFGMAASTVVSHHIGAGHPETARKAGGTGLKMGLAYMAAIGLTFVVFPKAYFALFRPESAAFTAEELVGVGRVMLWMMAGWGLLDTATIVLSNALKGAGDTRFVMMAMLAAGWGVLVPGVAFLLFRGAGVLALWAWLGVYVSALAVCFLWRWRRGRWENIRLIER